MSSNILTIHVVIENSPVQIPYNSATISEDVCIVLCKQLFISPVARHLFALRITGKQVCLMPCATFGEKQQVYDFRIRYKVANILKLKEIDKRAYDYYFHQARNDVLENNIPDLIFEKYKSELIGLGVTDMYRVMLEKDIPRKIVENDYKKYIHKKALKRHSIFIKKPIRDYLGKITESGHDAWYVKMEYLKELDLMAPEYLAEEYKALTDQNGSICDIYVKLTPNNILTPVIQVCYDSKRKEWHHICTIEELCFISVRKDGTVEISRKNGIPFYLKFNSVPSMLSFVSLLDGYYRLICKWIFNLCKDVSTPSLQKLYAMKCHGPVGGEFSYAKLEEKRGNHPGCFILRESETKYNTYYIDVCMKDSMKPKTFKLERVSDDEFIFNDDLRRYTNIHQLMAAYNDPQESIYLKECLPPSEYDNSPLLLCKNKNEIGDSLTDSAEVCGIIPTVPLCINSKDIQVYKGIEYGGHLMKTESGVRCQLWEIDNPLHKIDESLTNNLFPEKSRKKARNYCRNPSRDPKGPWCYTLDPNLIDETCGIPLCSYNYCRVTGSGIEYGGEHNHAASDRKCLKWDKARGKVKYRNDYIKEKKFSRDKFPERDLVAAKKFCRNPNGDIGGPWCYVEIEDTGEVEHEYCDISFCDDQDCTVFSRNSTMYSHYLGFNDTLTNFTFGLKLWDSDSFSTANARIVLSVLALPLSGPQIGDTGVGIEISISNEASALSIGNIETPEYVGTIGILKSTEFTFFSLSWGGGFMSLTKEGVTKPIFIAEYRTKRNLLGFMKDKFYYYSVQGTNILWSFPFCDDKDQCDIHTTTTLQNQKFWLLQETTVGRNLHLFVRAFHSAHILLVSSPPINYPRLEIMLHALDNFTRIVCIEYENGPKTILEELVLPSLLDYWKWNEFSVTLFADTLQLYWTKSIGTHLIMQVTHKAIKKIRWFSPSSYNSVAHWTFYCKPPTYANPQNAWPPECVLSDAELNYEGTQSVTFQGLPCMPWSTKKLLPTLFSEKENIKAVNYCRDPREEKKGTYCFVINQESNWTITEKYCHLRKCISSECRMSGTGNDYVGKLNKTRSNRTCADWINYVVNNSINYEYLNDTLYPDMNAQNAKNFCRNPSRTIAGTWCYTTDPLVPVDLCNVKDCHQPEEFIIVVKELVEGQHTYILPQWKEAGIYGGLHFALKQWNPDFMDGIVFDIKSFDKDKQMKLIIGAEYNEKIYLFFQSELVKQKSVSRIIPSGKWVLFWLQIRRGEIMLGYEGISNPFFEWKHTAFTEAFEPIFLTYSTIEAHAIGAFFKYDDCLCEETNSNIFNKIMPIGLWAETESLIYKNFTLNVRGTGSILVSLMIYPETQKYHTLVFNIRENKISFIENDNFISTQLICSNVLEPLYLNNSWVSYDIIFSESTLKIYKDKTEVLSYKSSSPLLFYWFSVGAENGTVTWTVNCEPPDFVGEPLDGGWSHWSPWQCSVTCGGGEGFRTRTCSNPRPNVFGKLCQGPSTSTGFCNTFECGDLSPETIDKIRDHLQAQDFSLEVLKGEPVVIENDRDILDIISIQSPDAYYEWTLNGVFPSDEPERIHFSNGNIYIRNADLSDMGVYVCMLYRVNNERLVFRVVSVAVTTKEYVIVTRASLDLIMKSNAVVLSYVYSDLRQKWLLNDSIYIDYGTTTLAAVSTEHLKLLNESHTGVWKCVVEHTDLGLSWVTNVMKIKVKRAPNLYTHLREDDLTAPLFAWLRTDQNVFIALITVIVFVCFIVGGCIYVYLKCYTLPKTITHSPKKYKRNRRKCQKKESLEGITMVYRSMWRLTKGKKIEVAMKVLKHEYCEKYLKDFLDLTGNWAFIQSSAIVRLFGITLKSPVSMVIEYMRLGSLDVYLKNNRQILKPVDLVEAASNLASALWHLEENGIVHGNIRCRKLLVSAHEENTFNVKLSDPGIHHSYASKEVHWIPVECYSNLEFAKRSTEADVWAFGTTLWEIFMYGEDIKHTDHIEAMRFYASGKRLPQPSGCPHNIYQLMRECWNVDRHQRKQPQALMRDINQILYQVYNSRRIHSYAKIFTKSSFGSENIVSSSSTNSLFSNTTESTSATGYQDELISITDISKSDTDLSVAAHFSGAPTFDQKWTFNNQHLTDSYDNVSSDLSTMLSNFNFSVATSATSLDSISSMQSIFELDADCNVILQGRIGQGFYGEVYKGMLEYLGDKDTEPRQVAVKKLKTSAVSTCLQDFEREISIMKTLKHPNIVEILGVLQEPEVSLVMEFVQHGSLQSYLKIYRESLSAKQLLKYSLDIAKGMNYLGAKHIVHRDLAARNILVVNENHVKISDFGLAQVMGTNEYYILKTNRELPIKWYAPESLRDGKFSPRSDVWSYGVTMCEMFGHGEEPKLHISEAHKVEGQEQQVLLNAIENGARFPCPSICPQAVYVRLIYPCWKSNPHRRPTFLQLCEEAEDLLIQY